MRESSAAVRFASGLFILLAACSDTSTSAYDRGSTLIVSHRFGDDALNPSADTWAKFLVFLPLVGWSEEGELEGRLARSWEHSPDYREWTYRLRTDVRWHDGVPVTAHDVEFTLELLSRPEALYYPPGYIDAITVHDDSTLTIRSAQFALGEHWWAVYYPKHLLGELDPARLHAWEFWKRPVGNGPYRFARHEPATMFEFEANPDHYRGHPRIERVVLRFDREGRLTELLAGTVDVIATANPSQLSILPQDDRFRVYQYPDGIVRGLYWKCSNPLFEDPRVRRALTLAVDRPQLQRLLNIPADIPVVDGVMPPEDLRRGDVPPPLPFDTEGARTLLAEAGWADRDGDGVLERNGRLFRFTLLVQGGGSGVWSRAAVFIQDQLRDLGVQTELEGLDAAVVRERLRNGEFEAVLTFFWPYDEWLQEIFGEESPLAYENAAIAHLVERLGETANPTGRGRLYRELTEIFQEEAPVTFMGPIAWTVLAHERLRGLSAPWRTNPLPYMDELWLKEEP